MHSAETKNKFIALRAENKSLRDIAVELQVDKSTLLLWNCQFGARIENVRRVELEHLQKQLLGSQADRFKALASDYLRYHKELESRKPQNVPQYMLFRMVCRLREQLEHRVGEPQFLPEPDQATSQQEEKP